VSISERVALQPPEHAGFGRGTSSRFFDLRIRCVHPFRHPASIRIPEVTGFQGKALAAGTNLTLDGAETAVPPAARARIRRGVSRPLQVEVQAQWPERSRIGRDPQSTLKRLLSQFQADSCHDLFDRVSCPLPSVLPSRTAEAGILYILPSPEGLRTESRSAFGGGLSRSPSECPDPSAAIHCEEHHRAS